MLQENNIEENKPTIPVRKIVLIFLAIIVPLAFIWYIVGQPLRSRASSEYNKQINLYPGSTNTKKGSGTITIDYDAHYMTNHIMYLSGSVKLSPNRQYNIFLCTDADCRSPMSAKIYTDRNGVGRLTSAPIEITTDPVLVNRVHVDAINRVQEPYCTNFGHVFRCLVSSVKLFTFPVTPTPTPVMQNLSLNKPVILYNGNVNYGTNQNTWTKAVDGNINTYWLNQSNQVNNRAELVVDLGKMSTLNKITYAVMWDTKYTPNALIGFYVSNDNKNFSKITVQKSINSRTAIQQVPSTVLSGFFGRYIKIRWEDNPDRAWNGWSELHELTVYGN